MYKTAKPYTLVSVAFISLRQIRDNNRILVILSPHSGRLKEEREDSACKADLREQLVKNTGKNRLRNRARIVSG
jgi:hypothetical protein